MKLYMLIAYEKDGTPKYKIGGGSSTPARPRVFDNREQAERQARIIAGRTVYAPIPANVRIIEVDVPAADA